MSTERQIALQLKREQSEVRRDVIGRVSSAALTILHESYFYGTRLWPKDGFRSGDGTSVHNKECIFLGVLAPAPSILPIKGRLHLWPTSIKESRIRSQKKHIRMILDYAAYDDITFEDEFRNTTWFDTDLWFTFTINK